MEEKREGRPKIGLYAGGGGCPAPGGRMGLVESESGASRSASMCAGTGVGEREPNEGDFESAREVEVLRSRTLGGR